MKTKVKVMVVALNNYLIFTEDGIYCQSYDTIIAFKDNRGKVYLDSKSWNFSVTTGKHRNSFLGEDKKQTEAKIKSGKYELIDLN